MELKRTFLTNGSAGIVIVGGYPDGDPYLQIQDVTQPSLTVLGHIDDKKEIERLAVNILKLLNSKKLKP